MLQFAQRKSALGTKQSCELCVLFMVGPLPMTRAVTATLAVVDLNCAHGFKRSPFQPASLPASLGSFCKITFFRGGAGVRKPRQSLCGLNLSDAIFLIFESTAVGGSGVLALLLGLPLVPFSWQLSQLRIR